MIKQVKYIIIFFFASYFLMAGAGYNVVNYCCKACADEGIEAVSTSSCFAVHHHITTNVKYANLSCKDQKLHPENCHLFRLNTDIPSFHAIKKLHLEQINTVYLFNTLGNFFVEKPELSYQINIPPPGSYLSLSGRTILAFNAVLLI